MKILKLEFENVNSLAGKWTIDFTAPVFAQSNDFFAITGPTGAGKSSILDAICLGLYGMTPRQGEITSENNVMTKGTKSCFARVTYECRNGLFRSHWEQSYKTPTRGKNKGKETLDDYLYSIEKNEDGNWIEMPDLKGRAALAKATADILGLDYAQFTKSILLAQGAFSEFIKSKSEERSAILEKLTGNEKYRLIAQKVWERAKNEKELFESKQKEIAECTLSMDKEKYEASKASIDGLSKKLAAFDLEIMELADQLNWLNSLAAAKKNLADAMTEQQMAVAAKSAFAAQEGRLDAAERAAKAESAYKLFADAKNALAKGKKDQAEITETLGKKQMVLSEAEAALQKMSGLHGAEVLRRANEEPLWDAVSLLDQEIVAAERNAREKQNVVDSEKMSLKSHRSALQDNAEKLAKAENARDAEVLYQKENGTDARISDNLSRLQEEARLLRQELADLAAAKEKEAQAKALVNENTEKLNVECKKLADVDSYLNVHGEDDILTREVSKFETLKNALQVARKELLDAHEHVVSCSEKTTRAKGALASATTSLNKATAEKCALEADGLPKIAAALRSHLKAGEACPVCGSREHSADSCDGAEELGTASALASQLNALADVERLASESKLIAEKELERFLDDLKKAETERNEKQETVNAQEAALAEAWAPWNLSVSSDEIEKSFLALKDRGNAYAVSQNSKAAIQESLSKAKESFNLATVNFDACKNKVADSEKKISELGKKLGAEFAPWFSAFRVEDVDAMLTELADKKKKWQASIDAMNKAATELSGYSAAAKTLAENVKDAETALAEAVRESAVSKATLDDLRAKRKEKFGDKNVATEKQNLAEKIKGLEADVTRCTQARNDAKSLCDGLQGTLEKLKQTLKESEDACSQKKSAFVDACVRNGFASEDLFLAARLADDERAGLLKTRNALQTAVDKANGSVAQAGAALDACRAKKLCPEDAAPALTERQNALRGERETNRSALENARIVCREYEANAAKNQKLRQEYETLRTSFEKWDKMRDLFGKQNGGDFVEFVQGITFGTLLQEANRQLVQMAPRYEFFQKQEDPLGLWIVDHDNGDEERPVSNLSGGETFLASLALALGIASLASENVSVDTLFLDEGFGTLDETTLHNVITVLQELQQREGKMLGIITHVETLKGEVPLQICVERIVGNEGRSRLVCDGVVTSGLSA